jgi:MFS superfamily sulfate permease-like transporter
MYIRLNRAQRTLPVILGIGTLVSVGVLFVLDAVPELFPLRAHDYLAAFPLAMIAIAYLTYQAVRRTARAEFVKALLLAMAFLLWSANQFWPNWKGAIRLNDLAIALFVLDVFLVMIGWPASSPDESFAETLSVGEAGTHSALPAEDRAAGK